MKLNAARAYLDEFFMDDLFESWEEFEPRFPDYIGSEENRRKIR